jgi:ABC-type nitrate/sulfonate/bicarbonate transport system permease component
MPKAASPVLDLQRNDGRDEPVTRVAFRGAGFEPRAFKLAAIIAFAIVLLAWELASQSGTVSPLLLPSPSAVFSAFTHVLSSGDLFRHIGASLYRIVIGWCLGTTCGILIGLLIGISGIARSVGIPMVSAIFPIPKIALLPLLILWLGIGEPSKIATIALGVFFPTVISTYTGVDSVPRNLIRMAQSFGLQLGSIIRSIILPAALPAMLAGARISSSVALLLVVSAEMIGANEGIGTFVINAGNLMQTDQLLVGVAMLAVLGLTISAVLGRLERRLLRWR